MKRFFRFLQRNKKSIYVLVVIFSPIYILLWVLLGIFQPVDLIITPVCVFIGTCLGILHGEWLQKKYRRK